MINCEILESSGYCEFKDSYSTATKCYQKRIRRSNGDTAYFVNVYYHRMVIPDREEVHESYELNLAFEVASTAVNYAWVKYQINVNSNIIDLEDFAHDVWVGNKGKNYD
jgi:hypothetical protein